MALSVVPAGRTPDSSTANLGKGCWTLHGHDDEVLSGAACRNLFATCSADGGVLVWRVAPEKDPEHICKLATGGPAAMDICFTDGGRCLAIAQGDATVSLWDLENGKRLESVCRCKVPGRASWPVVNAVTMTAENTLCYGGDDGYLTFSDIRSPQLVTSVNRKAPITALSFANATLFAGDACGHLCGFDSRMSWRNFMNAKCSSDALSSVSCSEKGDQVAAYAMDGKLALVDTQPFAVTDEDRLLSSAQVSYGESRVLKRGDWSSSLGAVLTPAAGEQVAVFTPSYLPAGPTRFLRRPGTRAGGTEDEVHFAKAVGARYAVFGGSASLTLQEW